LARSPTLTIDRNLAASIATTRFGLGARPGEIAKALDDPKGYLAAQVRLAGADPTQVNPPTLAQRMQDLLNYKAERAQDKDDGGQRSPAARQGHRELREDTAEDFNARLRLAVTTPDSFRERWALFWINHFTVSAAKMQTATLLGPFENEAIRPHAFGRFEDMLVASSSHPAMLYYLDQAPSVGPDSIAAQNQERMGKHVGLNENLAREIMELHTVGVEAAYSQTDVTEFARAMTGWTVGAGNDPPERHGQFYFRERAHEPGRRVIMGRTYADGGVQQAREVMHDLAANPHTAHHIALKLARHFVADDPPPSLVAGLTQSYMTTGGRLADLALTLVSAPEAWDPTPQKFKTPYEFLVSAWRATDNEPYDYKTASGVLTFMGQKPLMPPSPKGWPEEAQIWCAPDAVIKRMNWSENFATRAGADHDPMLIADNALGARLSPLVAKTISRAETRAEGLAILLMSPEFQRR